jgi:hypothetical protein
MAQEPVAISKMSPAPATERDYDSICAALMQTERGRWFLQEYARRNRSADTQVLLAAIERIEAVVCAERNRQVQPGIRSDLLEMAKAITRTRAEVAEIRADTAARFPPDGPDSEAVPARQPQPGDVFAAAERIRDVTWAMRGHGFDPSTCDQLEELAGAILSASSLRDPTDHRASKLSEVLQYLEHRIDTLLESNQDGDALASELASEPDHDAFDPAPTGEPVPADAPAIDTAEPEAGGGTTVSALNASHNVAMTAHDYLEGDAAVPGHAAALAKPQAGFGDAPSDTLHDALLPAVELAQSHRMKSPAARAVSTALREAAAQRFLPEIDMQSDPRDLSAAPAPAAERLAIGLAGDAAAAPTQLEGDGAANFSPPPCGEGLQAERCDTWEQDGTSPLPNQDGSESPPAPSQPKLALTGLVPGHIPVASPESLAAPPLAAPAALRAVPAPPRGDPLAALKAMSDDELIALFS